MLSLPSSALVTFDPGRDIRILIHLFGELGVVVDSGANESKWDLEVRGCLIHITGVRSHRRHHLVHAEPRSDDQRLAPTGCTFVEPDERVALETDRLAEQPVDERVS